MTQFSLQDLQKIIAARANAPADQSYAAKLTKAGINKASEKFGEEAIEAIIAAVAGDRSELINETADVLYHLLVVLKMRDISIEDVMAELQTRTAQSGLEEKASRL